MKNIILIFVAIFGLSSVGFAEESTAVENLEEDKGFYLGLAYSHLSHDVDHETLTTNVELDFNAVMLQLGYKFNPYIAVEAKYNLSLNDTDMDDQVSDADLSVLSLFIKPMYPIAPEADIYLLLGYSLTDASYADDAINVDESTFSWGAGASYDMTEDFAVLAEYTHFYDDTINGFDHVIDSFNIGVNYKF